MSTIQPITKVLLGLTVGITLLPLLNIAPDFALLFINFKPFLFQGWRYFTSFFLLGDMSNPVNAVMRIYALYSHSNDIEVTYFMKQRHYIYYLLFNIITVILLTFYFPGTVVWRLESCLQMFLSYSWSNINYDKQIKYFGVIPVTAKYVCIIDLIVNFLFSGGDFVASSGILGLVSGYLYHCIATNTFGPLYGFIKIKVLRQTETPYKTVKSRSLNGKVTTTKVPNRNFQLGSNSNYGYGGGSCILPYWFSSITDFTCNKFDSIKNPEKALKSTGSGRRLGTSPAPSFSSAPSSSSTATDISTPVLISENYSFRGQGRRLGG